MGADSEPCLHGCTATKSVVAHSGKALWKDVLEPSSDEFVRAEVDGSLFSCLAGFPAEADVSVRVCAEDSAGVKGAALDVSGEVAEGCFPLPNMLELDVPRGAGAEGSELF